MHGYRRGWIEWATYSARVFAFLKCLRAEKTWPRFKDTHSEGSGGIQVLPWVPVCMRMSHPEHSARMSHPAHSARNTNTPAAGHGTSLWRALSLLGASDRSFTNQFRLVFRNWFHSTRHSTADLCYARLHQHSTTQPMSAACYETNYQNS